jgi:hypothetical protein
VTLEQQDASFMAPRKVEAGIIQVFAAHSPQQISWRNLTRPSWILTLANMYGRAGLMYLPVPRFILGTKCIALQPTRFPCELGSYGTWELD